MAVSLEVRYTKEEQQGNLYSYGLLVEVISGTEMATKIFVVRRGVRSATDSEVDEPSELDEFQWIASPLELDQFPEDDPNLAAGIPYYRVDSIRFSFRSVGELAETLDLIKGDISKLVRSMQLETEISDVEVVTYNG